METFSTNESQDEELQEKIKTASIISDGNEVETASNSSDLAHIEKATSATTPSLSCIETVENSPIQIITSLVEDIDVNSDYMYSGWCPGSTTTRSDDSRSHDFDEIESVTNDQSLKDEMVSSSHEEIKTESSDHYNVDKQDSFTTELEEKNDSAEPEAELRIEHVQSNQSESVRKTAEHVVMDDSETQADVVTKTSEKIVNKGAQVVDSLIKSANTDVENHKYKRALEKYEEALAMARELDDTFLLQSCACNLGAVLVILGQADRAVRIMQQQIKRKVDRNSETDMNAQADIFYNLGLAYHAKEDAISAMECFQRAIQEFVEWKNYRGIADAHNQLAELHVRRSQLEEARSNYHKAAEFYGKVGNGLMKARMSVKEARMLNRLVDADGFQRAMATCEKASTAVLKQKTSTGTTSKQVKLFHDMAVLCRKQEREEDALRWMEQAWKRCHHGNHTSEPGPEDLRLKAAVGTSLARMYLHSYDMINAIHVYQEAAQLHGYLGHQAERGWCFYHLAEAYTKLCDYTNAERSYHVAHQHLTDAGEREHLWKVTEGLGDLNMAREHPDLATMYYREALAMGVHLHSRNKSSSEKLISKLSRALEDHKAKRLDLVSAREKRVPILVGYDPNGRPIATDTHLDGSNMSIQQAVFPSQARKSPTTSTPKADFTTRHRKSTEMRSIRHRKGKRESSHTPVARGIGYYNSETDLSLVNGSIAAGLRQTYYEEASHKKKKKKHKKKSYHLEVVSRRDQREQRSVTPPGSSSGSSHSNHSSDDDDDEEDRHHRHSGKDRDNTSSDSGFKNMWRRAKELVTRLESSSEDSELSSSEDGDEDERGGDSRTMPGGYRHDEDEGIHSKNSNKLDNTYEQPLYGVKPNLYATVNKKGMTQTQKSEHIYETLRGTRYMGSSMPTREPPPPVVPIQSHPSLNKKKKNQPSTSYDNSEDDDSFTSVTEDELEALTETLDPARRKNYPTTTRMSRGGLEAGLYEIQKLEDERKKLRESNASSIAEKVEKKQSSASSRVCSIM